MPLELIGKSLPNYSTPPVVEVACGVEFEPISGLKVPYYGILWERLRSTYPRCDQVAPLGLLPDVIEPPNLPIPRVWFLDKDGANLVQVQNDRLLVNWRKMTAESVTAPGIAGTLENRSFRRNALWPRSITSLNTKGRFLN